MRPARHAPLRTRALAFAVHGGAECADDLCGQCAVAGAAARAEDGGCPSQRKHRRRHGATLRVLDRRRRRRRRRFVIDRTSCGAVSAKALSRHRPRANVRATRADTSAPRCARPARRRALRSPRALASAAGRRWRGRGDGRMQSPWGILRGVWSGCCACPVMGVACATRRRHRRSSMQEPARTGANDRGDGPRGAGFGGRVPRHRRAHRGWVACEVTAGGCGAGRPASP